MEKPTPCILLLSGGLDSTTTLAVAKELGYDVYALSFDYGQRHRVELDAATKIAQCLGVKEHKVVTIDLRLFGKSALTDDIDVPKDSVDEHEIPVTYVPARNTIFLSFALAYAETVGAFDIFIGANQVDYSGYPDCRPQFLKAFTDMANLATAATVDGKQRFQIHAPLIDMTKADIIKTGIELGVDYGLTTSCYDPDADGKPCGHCDSCRYRQKGFAACGIHDPRLKED